MQRRAGAPRLIDWTGERCVPWAPDVQVVYEHLHRYLWARSLVGGRRVLDLASGEGFGAAILAESASSVVGVDLDERTVEHSRLNYAGESLEFQIADALDLSRFEAGSFGAVVAFEMIEHVSDHDRLLAEISRVLTDDGLLIISTPDRAAYTDATGVENPFHVHELTCSEFLDALGSTFAHVAAWCQRTITGSMLSSRRATDPSAPPRTYFIERASDGWQEVAGISPLYIVAVASNAELPSIPSDSTLGDCGLGLLRAAEEGTAAAVRAGELEVERCLEALAGQRRVVEETSADRQRLVERHGREQAELRQVLADRDVEVDLLRGQAEELREAAKRSEDAISLVELELANAQRLNWRVEHSVSWQLFQRIRGRVFKVLGGERSRRAHSFQALLRLGGRVIRGRSRGPASAASQEAEPASPPSIVFPVFDQPAVSVLIPAYGRADLTRACLESLRDFTARVSYEVIIVDDDADDATKDLLASVRGARILVNEKNIGYLRSVNQGAARARGRWLVLCNNDIEVREGWLTELLVCGESSPDIAIVTPKYMYPDLSLSEAGGVIWRDGTGGNYGRGDNPGYHQYEYRREVDYGSAAALLVRIEFWRAVGGFDERFLPMYYEDADLCFQARERGLKVMYEPRAQVIHVEGATAGVDVGASYKRYQEINRPKFVDKWRACLESEHLLPSLSSWRAANRLTGTQVLVVDHRVPWWDRDAGSLRMRWIIEKLIGLGCQVTFLSDCFDATEPYTTELRRMGVDVLTGPVDMAAEFRMIGPELAMAIMSRPHPTSRWLDAVREFAPDALAVFDTVDLHWLRIARRTAMDSGTSGIELGPQATAMHELELGLVRATDVTLVVSEEERARVNADVPDAVVLVVPTVHEIRTPVPPAHRRAGVLFIGGFEHTPNIEAARRLVHDVMPIVWRAVGTVPVTIVGPSAPPEVQNLASARVEVAGWVEHVDPLIDSARVLVAPMSYGAGQKGKVTQALAAGLPVVTTSIGAEGFDAGADQILVADSNEELAEHVIRVLRDDDLWERQSIAGQELAEERCSPSLVTEKMRNLLELGRRGSEVARGA